ncbi:Senescence-associated protein [Quillaja saponaria]|uniref:Senescence-associated protein n=1 Tax=Quillaja saponaria TaxID=32244 RepID=A0AAD7LKZ7_QUISA|nr:Senescence-associated protein [Quillaja saponaria]
MLKKIVSEKTMLYRSKKKKKNDQSVKNNRFLIIINIVGSVGPIRFIVNEGDLVSGVIDTALKCYARQGRLPVLGSDVNDFLLYCENAESQALSPKESIGSHGARKFVLCKMQKEPLLKAEARSEMVSEKRSGWKSWLNKSFSFKIISDWT